MSIEGAAAPGRGERGFTLLEVTVALAVLLLTLGGLLRALDAGMRAVPIVDRQHHAVTAATTIVEELGHTRELAPGLSEGTLPTGEHWRLMIGLLQRHDNDPNSALEFRVDGYTVDIVIFWEQRGQAADLSFHTVLLGARP